MTIPSVFHYTGNHGAGSFNRVIGEQIKPAAEGGQDQNPAGRRKEAHDACKDFRDSPKAREKCIFDFMLMGKPALKDTKKDRMAQRIAAQRKPTEKSVRDISRYKNHAVWSSTPSWGCVAPFLKAQEVAEKAVNAPANAVKQLTEAQHKEAGAKCEEKMSAQLQTLRGLTVGQPIYSKDKKKCINIVEPVVRDGKPYGKLEVSRCSGRTSEQFVYNRLAGGTLHTKDGKLCMTRPKTDDVIRPFMTTCHGGDDQIWRRECGAWVNGHKKAGRILEFTSNDEVIASKWTGSDRQLNHYTEVVKHSQCGNKRFKTMQFDGTDGSAVMMRNFIGMPSKKLTVAAWVKGHGTGTIFSYSSKHKLNSFVIRNLGSLEVFIRNNKISTGVSFNDDPDKWVHVAVTWESKRGKISVFKNGERVYKKTGFSQGERITAGGCLIVGQSQSKYCRRMVKGQSFKGQVVDLQMWSEDLRTSDLYKLWKFPVPTEVITKAGKTEAPDAPKKLRLAFLSRQYGSQELNVANPPVCDLDKYKEAKKVTGPSGNMYWRGSGDVHYRNFANCHYDDQSVGEWVAVKIDDEYMEGTPLMIQYRTSPQRTHCPWCQNGAVSYIDGCAISFMGDRASAGFGGYSDRYSAYAAFNGKRMNSWHQWHHAKNLRARGDSNHFQAISTDGINLRCYRGGSIYLTLPAKYSYKIGGIAGTGMNRGTSNPREWWAGPNSGKGKACPECRESKTVNGLVGQCPSHYVYGYRNHPLNGNHLTKPLVRFFKSWQVDGDLIPSMFYYTANQGPGSFNRNNGEAIKPPRDVNKNPSGKRKAAHDACKDFRNNPGAREKCIFDFMLLGKKALKATKKDRMEQRQSKSIRPTDRSVRDMSQYKNDGVWASHRNWGCVGDFLEMQGGLSTEKPRKPLSPLKWIKEKSRGWDSQGAKPLFGASHTDEKNRFQGTLKECQDKCQRLEDCVGITRYVNDGKNGNCWGWSKGSATKKSGHMVSYLIDRTGALTKQRANVQEFDSEAVNGQTVQIDLPGKESLNLAEVAVFDASGEELEIADLQMSSVESPEFASTKCMDGNVHTYCATKAGGEASWLKVHLTKATRIGKVSLINRQKAGQKRIQGAVVTVIGKGKTVWESSELQGGSTAYDLLTRPAIVPGSFIALEGGHTNMFCVDHGRRPIKCNKNRIKERLIFRVSDGGNGLVAFTGGKHAHKYWCAPDDKNKFSCQEKDKKKALFRPIQVGGRVAFRMQSDKKFCEDSLQGVKCGVSKQNGDVAFKVKCIENCGAAASNDEGKIPLGSFFLQSATGDRCVHPLGGQLKDDTQMVFHSGCDADHLALKLVAGEAGKGYFIQNVRSGMCLQPAGGEADEDGVKLVLQEGCDFDRYLFSVEYAGNGAFRLKNTETGRCLRPVGGSASRDNTGIEFAAECQNDNNAFILEPRKDQEAQFQTYQLTGSPDNWDALGPNAEFSSHQGSSAPTVGRQIKNKLQQSRCLQYRGRYGGPSRRRRRGQFNPKMQYISSTRCSSNPSQSGQALIYDRLEGGTLRDKTGSEGMCLTRNQEKLHMKPCTGGSDQKWRRTCGAFANGDKAKGRVLMLQGTTIKAEKWYGTKDQLWSFEEVVEHNECSNKRFKVMHFDGSPNTAVISRNFIGMPGEKFTVNVWVKGTSGTVFSYSSKNTLRSVTMRIHFSGIDVYIRDKKVAIPVKLTAGEWSHLALSWDNRAGDVTLSKNGKHVFHKRGVAAGESITAGGCLVIGQRQKQSCSGLTESYTGDISDFQIWTGVLNPIAVKAVMEQPVPQEVIDKAGKVTAPEPHKNLRLAYLSRQFGSQELGKETCDLDAYKAKKPLTGPGGHMWWGGSGDVHYRNFANCHYDDQSVGEWVAVQVKKEYWEQAPLMIQYRTSPQRTHCPWCQNGAVSYIDGCAVQFHGERASAGFGGFSDPYSPYAAFNGRPINNGHWHHGKNMRVRATNSYMYAVLTDGTNINCRRHSIGVNLPRKYTGKVQGLAGSGLGGNVDWKNGPNRKACPECVPGQTLPGLKGQCPSHYVYGYPNHPLNGNRNTKPLVRFMQSWQVDGEIIPSAFYYQGNHGAGSFNRKNGEKIKPPSGTNKQPNSKKEQAKKACKDFRNSPGMREKCIFDFMILGKVALKDSKRDRMEQRKNNMKKPNSRSVRDLSRYKNTGEWSGSVSWGCAGEFLDMQGSAVKRFSAQHKEDEKKKPSELAELHQNAPTTIPRGNWIESTKTFGLPIDVEAEIKSHGAPGSIFMSLFNRNNKKNGGLTIETGVEEDYAKIYESSPVKQKFEVGDNADWHVVRIKVDSDGKVQYFINGKLLHKSRTKLNKGKLAFIGGSHAMELKNVKVTAAASEIEKSKRKCFAAAAADPQDAGDAMKLPPCPAFTCEPSLCLCTCPGTNCQTFAGVIGA
jgi:hypothetical protein